MNLLYLLVNEEESAVKIGVSYSPQKRAAQLPVRIKLERSIEVEFNEGSPNSVERILHYLFRDHKYQMPSGDGCTEWFRIEVLPEILQFLENEGRRLGVTRMCPLPARLPIQAFPKDTTTVQTQTDKLNARRIKEEIRAANHAEALVRAQKHNAEAYDWIRITFQDMYTANLIAGVLSNANDSAADGHLYLHGESRKSALDHLSEPRFFTVIGPGRQRYVFTGSFFSSTYEFARISISKDFVSESLPVGHEEREPGADQIRNYLHSLTARVGSLQYQALIQIREELHVKQARSCKEWQREWL